VLIDFLRTNADVFAWSPSDMPGIPRDVTEHSLDIRAGARPMKQPLRRFDKEKRRAIGKEIHKLMAAGFIKEKLLYAVILTRRKLRHYFEPHLVTVVSSFPLGEIIQCREASGRIAK
jgi:hypothetical protein